MDRRTLLKTALTFLGATTAASFFYPLLRFLAPPGVGAKAEKLTLMKGEIPVGEAKEIVFNNVPGIVINRPQKGYIALSKVCTHLGCLVQYEKARTRLFCPCHAGVYDLDGNVVAGPPPKPLPRLPLRIEGEKIEIG